MLPPVSLLLLLNLSLYQSYAPRNGRVDPPCPFHGQIYPPPVNINRSPIWQQTISDLRDTISALPSLQQNVSSYGIKVVSLHESASIFEHYNKAPDHLHGENGTTPVDGDTVFRIASVSKMFTVYALLLKGGFRCFEDSITQYVPELNNQNSTDSITSVDWDEVTVGMLASQMSGIGRDFAMGDLTVLLGNIPPSLIGLPDLAEIDPSELVTCNGGPSQQPCSREESLKRMIKHAPSFPTWYTPAYSNMAFQLLGYAIENMTGQSYAEVMKEAVFQPLNLKHTYTSLPRDPSEGVMMPNNPFFAWNIGDAIPAGGIYASTNDLATHALAVLNSTQLKPSHTRRWLKPHSWTSDDFLSFGSPWEILHVPGISAHHQIDVYCKLGDLPPYNTFYALIPELDVAIVANALTDDPSSSATALGTVVLQHLQKPLYEVAKTQIRHTFSGTFIDDRPNVNSTITITTDDEIGLLVSHWISNGTDMIVTGEQFDGIDRLVRLFPTTLTSTRGDSGIKKVAFRGTVMNPGGPCVTWGPVDGYRYGGKAMDSLVFEVEDDKAVAVRLPAYRARLVRVEHDRESGGQRLNVQS